MADEYIPAAQSTAVAVDWAISSNECPTIDWAMWFLDFLADIEDIDVQPCTGGETQLVSRISETGGEVVKKRRLTAPIRRNSWWRDRGNASRQRPDIAVAASGRKHASPRRAGNAMNCDCDYVAAKSGEPAPNAGIWVDTDPTEAMPHGSGPEPQSRQQAQLASAAESTPLLGAQEMLKEIYALNGAGRSCTAQGEAVLEAPGTEEEWRRRHHKRRDAIRIIKEGPAYQSFLRGDSPSAKWRHLPMVVPVLPDALRPDVPVVPDPMDRSISKRMWEASVMNWRTQLRPWGEPVLLVDNFTAEVGVHQG